MPTCAARLFGSVVALAAFGPLPATSAVTTNSLRLVRRPVDIHLSWSGDPAGVYRAVAARAIRSAPNLLGLSTAVDYDDPTAPLTGRVYFYQVGDEALCGGDADCDDGIACTIDSCTPAGCAYAAGLGIATELAGRPLTRYPWFDYIRAVNVDADASVAIDPGRFPAVAGRTCDVYVLATRDPAAWCADPSLTDVRGAPDTRSFSAGSIRDNTFPLITPLLLSADAGVGLGVGYDVVLDCDRDRRLGAGDYIDGGVIPEAGVYLVHDLTLAGPLAVSTFEEIGPLPPWPGPWTDEGDDLRVYYPSLLDDPAWTGTFPLVVVSHGNGHRFSWYDFLGEHLASYGYIVMAHDNNTSPGISTASLSTLRFMDRLLGEQATLGGGVLDRHIDHARTSWIGHSRGGEGVARAYDRLHDEGYAPANFVIGDIVVVSSIAPTDFLGAPLADPHEVPYDLLYGSSDGDVSGCTSSDVTASFNIFERAAGTKSSLYVHGADHNDFNCCGFNDFDGPAATEIGRAEAQQVQKAHYLALIKHHVEGNLPAKDFLWRQTEALRPIGVAASTVTVLDYKDAATAAVLDDFQAETSVALSSSGGAVVAGVTNLVEDLLNDPDVNFNHADTEWMNGMTRVNTDEDPDDVQRGAVFEWVTGGDTSLEFAVVPGLTDLSAARYLSFRACQRTRHPQTDAVAEDLAFTVTLDDAAGTSSSIRIDAYDGGIEEPYARGGCGGRGAGWQNEFEVIRIRLTDFLNDGSGLDLRRIRAVRLDFGSSFGAAEGALGFDDLHLAAD